MPIHFDERDLISCVFYLGSVQKGGETAYYNGDKPDNPGQPDHQVYNRYIHYFYFFGAIVNSAVGLRGKYI